MTEEQWEPEEWDIDEIDQSAFTNAEWLIWEIDSSGLQLRIRDGKVFVLHGDEYLTQDQIQALKDLDMYVLTILAIREATGQR